jgi:hypothetical protein
MSTEKAPNGNLPIENATANVSDEKIDRRTAGARVGRFLAYTAPAVIALTTAAHANAS